MDQNLWPKTYRCTHCGTVSNTLVCPSRKCLAADEKVVGERKWQAGLKPAKPQEACDIGLFSDQPCQLDLVTLANTVRKP